MSMEGIQVSMPELIQMRHAATKLDLKHPSQVGSTLMGGYHSRLRGRGMDFAEVRAYHAGDDIRYMDWRVTARTGIAHTKLYTEERERSVYIVLNFTKSLFFGTKVAYKSVIAARLAAMLGWAAIQNGDRLGAVIQSSWEQVELRPRMRTHGLMPFLQNLVDLSAVNYTDDDVQTSAALYRLRRVVRPGSLIFLIGDFSDIDQDCERHLTHLSRSSEVIACFVQDPLEVSPPPANHYPITDGKSRSAWHCHSATAQHAYADYCKQKFEAVAQMCHQRAITLLTLLTNDQIDEVIARGLGQGRR